MKAKHIAVFSSIIVLASYLLPWVVLPLVGSVSGASLLKNLLSTESMSNGQMAAIVLITLPAVAHFFALLVLRNADASARGILSIIAGLPLIAWIGTIIYILASAEKTSRRFSSNFDLGKLLDLFWEASSAGFYFWVLAMVVSFIACRNISDDNPEDDLPPPVAPLSK